MLQSIPHIAILFEPLGPWGPIRATQGSHRNGAQLGAAGQRDLGHGWPMAGQRVKLKKPWRSPFFVGKYGQILGNKLNKP